MSKGYILVHRGLLEKAWFQQLDAEKRLVVICLIARANWKEVTLADGMVLQPGQLVVGRDELSKQTKVSERKIRTLFTILQTVGFSTSQTTSKGTIITLVNWHTYQDISKWFNEERPAKRPANDQRTTTTKEGKEYKEEDLVPENPGRGKFTFSEKDMTAAVYIWGKVLALQPNRKAPNMDAWANDIRLMVERDGRDYRQICELFQWANNHPFWKTNILCPDKLREKWDTLEIKRANPEPTGKTQPVPAPFTEFDKKSLYE